MCIATISNWQNDLCGGPDRLSSKGHEVLARLSAIPVSVLDVTLETIKVPLQAIEELALGIINLLGAAFSKNYTIRKALFGLDKFLKGVALTPVAIAIAPLKILYQLFAIAIQPQLVLSIQYRGV